MLAILRDRGLIGRRRHRAADRRGAARALIGIPVPASRRRARRRRRRAPRAEPARHRPGVPELAGAARGLGRVVPSWSRISPTNERFASLTAAVERRAPACRSRALRRGLMPESPSLTRPRSFGLVTNRSLDCPVPARGEDSPRAARPDAADSFTAEVALCHCTTARAAVSASPSGPSGPRPSSSPAAPAAAATPTDGGDASGEPLIVGTTDKVTTLDPAGSYDNGSLAVQTQVFPYLVNTDYNTRRSSPTSPSRPSSPRRPSTPSRSRRA